MAVFHTQLCSAQGWEYSLRNGSGDFVLLRTLQSALAQIWTMQPATHLCERRRVCAHKPRWYSLLLWSCVLNSDTAGRAVGSCTPASPQIHDALRLGVMKATSGGDRNFSGPDIYTWVGHRPKHRYAVHGSVGREGEERVKDICFDPCNTEMLMSVRQKTLLTY